MATIVYATATVDATTPVSANVYPSPRPGGVGVMATIGEVGAEINIHGAPDDVVAVLEHLCRCVQDAIEQGPGSSSKAWTPEPEPQAPTSYTLEPDPEAQRDSYTGVTDAVFVSPGTGG